MAVWVLCALNVVTQVVVGGWSSGLRTVPVVGFVATAAWMLFVAPAVIVEPAAAVAKNPLRDVRIPWATIQDVQPSYTLQITTTQGRFRAWAAPGGSQLSHLPAITANEQTLLHLPLPDDGTLAMDALLDPHQENQTPSAAATLALRRGWQLAQHHTDHTTRGAETVTVRWHIPRLILLGAFLVASILAFTL